MYFIVKTSQLIKEKQPNLFEDFHFKFEKHHMFHQTIASSHALDFTNGSLFYTVSTKKLR